MPERSQVAVSQIIGENDYEIRLLRGPGLRNGLDLKSAQQEKEIEQMN